MGDIIINVVMTGGRRCGKTSVLAAMQGCLETLVGKTGITATPDNKVALDELEEKFRYSESIFREKLKYKDGFFPDGMPSAEIKHYPFRLIVDGKTTSIVIIFHDYPGERMKDDGIRDEIAALFSESRILVIAIDTPCLMEEHQKFDDRINVERRICEMVKRSGFAAKDKGEGMLIFVPLKCEKYYNEGRMDEVTDQVTISYAPLMQFILETAKQNSTSIPIVVTPILTMGGLAFSHFDIDDDGEIKTNQGLPDKPIYMFTNHAGTRPSPKFCEQPFLRILSYAISRAINTLKESRKKRSVIIGFLAGIAIVSFFKAAMISFIIIALIIYFLLKKDKSETVELASLANKISSITQSIKTSGDGYRPLR